MLTGYNDVLLVNRE